MFQDTGLIFQNIDQNLRRILFDDSYSSCHLKNIVLKIDRQVNEYFSYIKCNINIILIFEQYNFNAVIIDINMSSRQGDTKLV